jgi:hypothetical protein
MKKKTDVAHGISVYRSVVEKADSSGTLKQSLLQSGANIHPCTYNEESRVGAIYTHVKQDDRQLLIEETNENYAYAQYVGKNNKEIVYEKILKAGIRKLLTERGTIDNLKGHLLIKNSSDRIIVCNENNKQKFINVDSELRNKASDFVRQCGGELEVEKAMNFKFFCTSTLNSGKDLLYELSNNSPQDRSKILLKYEETHHDLIKLSTLPIHEAEEIKNILYGIKNII